MKRKKILFINGHLNTGGVERSLVDILKHIDLKKYEVELLLLEGFGDYYNEIPNDIHIYLYNLNEASGPFIKTMWKNLKKGHLFMIYFRLLMLLSRIFSKRILTGIRPFTIFSHKKYDIVIGFRTDAPTLFATYIIKAERRISWWHHGSMNLNKKQKTDLEREYLNNDKIVAVSKATAELLKVNFPNIENKILVIPNMVCKEDISNKADNKKLNLSNDFKIISIGRMSPEKNLEMCINVGKELIKSNLSFHWYIIGDGICFKRIQSLISDSKVEQYFTLTGKLSNPYPYLKKADLLFHPSLVESQGLTILESMALEIPVICVESDGPKEFITNGENGFLIKNDIKVASEKIELLWRDTQLRKSLIKRGSITVDSYSPDNIMSQIDVILNI